MSAAAKSTQILAALTATGAVAGASFHPAVRAYIEQLLGSGGASKMWKWVALAFAAINLKNVPFVWHIRVLRGIIYQLYFQPTPQQPKHLFAPLITSSYNTPFDCDYNLHKSNSTYFADLDVSRAHHMGCIIREGLRRLNAGDEAGLEATTRNVKGKYFVALGAVCCFFHKQIEPLQAFEIYTRVLAWDRKWIYLVSHIVMKGKIRPEGFVLQPWKKGGRKARKHGEKEQEDEEDLGKYVFATSVSRYVFKKGRLTINPEVVLQRSKLLPERPEGVGLPPRAEAEENGELLGESQQFVEVGEEGKTEKDPEEWTWEDMERERLRGLKIANHFDKLEGAQGELRAGEVLGKYGDYW